MKRLIRSFGYAFQGITSAFRTELNFRIHIVAAVIAVAIGFYLQLSLERWGLVILAIGFVIVSELFNTAIERLGDEVANGNHRLVIKKAKDTAAAAVFLSAASALVIGIIFLLIPFIQKVWHALSN
jgi:diacylglycerol kinase (ATP)